MASLPGDNLLLNGITLWQDKPFLEDKIKILRNEDIYRSMSPLTYLLYPLNSTPPFSTRIMYYISVEFTFLEKNLSVC